LAFRLTPHYGRDVRINLRQCSRHAPLFHPIERCSES
jgi:hypothetical protein